MYHSFIQKLTYFQRWGLFCRNVTNAYRTLFLSKRNFSIQLSPELNGNSGKKNIVGFTKEELKEEFKKIDVQAFRSEQGKYLILL